MQHFLTQFSKFGIGILCLLTVEVTIVMIAITIGLFLILAPKKVIEIQIAVYRPFNWKLEPISMEKEIRNTRTMGWAVCLSAAVALISTLFIIGK